MAIVGRQFGMSQDVEYHRLFDPFDMTFVYQSDDIGLIAASKSIRKLRDTAKKWLLVHEIWDPKDADAWYNRED